MNVEHVPNFKPPVKQMFELTDAVLSPYEFRSACEKIGEFDPYFADDDPWNFNLDEDGDSRLTVSLHMESSGTNNETGKAQYKPVAVICAILPFCWWETYERKNHKDDKSLRKEQLEYNRAFDEELKHAIQEIGQPAVQGADKKAPFHKHAIWRGKEGLFILQQSANDLQFGYDINYWIQPRITGEADKNILLIDWLHMINRIPPTITLPAGWEVCAAGFENELKRELTLNVLHPLKNVEAVSVARAGHADDFLFELTRHKHKLAQVHLTWNKEWRPAWPETTFYDSWQQWVASVKAENEE